MGGDLLEDVAVFLAKEDLVNVDAGPGVDDVLHDLLSLFFSHFETVIHFLQVLIYNLNHFITAQHGVLGFWGFGVLGFWGFGVRD